MKSEFHNFSYRFTTTMKITNIWDLFSSTTLTMSVSCHSLMPNINSENNISVRYFYYHRVPLIACSSPVYYHPHIHICMQTSLVVYFFPVWTTCLLQHIDFFCHSRCCYFYYFLYCKKDVHRLCTKHCCYSFFNNLLLLLLLNTAHCKPRRNGLLFLWDFGLNIVITATAVDVVVVFVFVCLM